LGASGVVAALKSSPGDIGLVPAASTAGGAWWSALEADDAPKIIARLPFVERADHPAGLPIFVLARPHPDAIVTEVMVWSLRVAGWGIKAAQAVLPFADVVAVPDRAFDGAALLACLPQARALAELTTALVQAGVSVRSQALVGSHARRYTVMSEGARPAPIGR
jgi:hypothetical protein